jgi:arginine deiminase
MNRQFTAAEPFLPAMTAPSVSWGVDSEYGRLEEVLLCAPDHMRWEPDANAVARMVAQTGKDRFDPELAKAQHAALAETLGAAGVTIRWLDPDPGQPSQTFTRDSSFMTPWGAVVTLMDAPVRRGEYAGVLQFYLSHGVPVWRVVTQGSVEGGDVHVVMPGKALIGYSDGRTTLKGARQVAGWFEEAGWEVRLQYFPEHFLHIDVLFCMLGEGVAVVCKDVLGDDFVRDVTVDYDLHTVVDVSYNEAMALGANGVALGDGKVLMARLGPGSRITERLRAEGLTVYDLDLSMFVLDGGGPHCLTMPLRRKSPAA